MLVKENNGTWSLPGGWVDVDQSIKSNTKKEVKEEAGLDVEPVRIIAVHDRNAHNRPRYAYGICKVFVQCRRIGGQFQANSETTESRCFALDELPLLAEEKIQENKFRCASPHITIRIGPSRLTNARSLLFAFVSAFDDLTANHADDQHDKRRDTIILEKSRKRSIHEPENQRQNAPKQKQQSDQYHPMKQFFEKSHRLLPSHSFQR
ncbi:ADP-ribose pyrophosphatase [Sporolactobacillus inulinus]|uniref:ADP-ribose pyrophosphatase n=1 Tax=Sporolactobacillus inulinus TaxID=2078 RepID=A0A4Y1ZIE2_9BACL|nr:NUDIX domain-containing protein [Sporolactobacillus inulinus]GAY78986.1 ADP-ribose pyrophosphatase [Sporolactobacillus inulinus]